MHTKSRTRTLAFLLAAFFVCGNLAHADYEVFDINPIPADQPIGNVNEYQMVGMSTPGLSYAVEYVSDSVVTLFDRLTLPFCRSGGANGGEIYLEVRSSTTTGPIVASSTLAVNSGNVWSTGCTSTIINATTSTFVLNRNVQWSSGVSWYFIFRPINTTGIYYFSFDVSGGANGKFLSTGSAPTWLGDYYWTSMVGYALGSTPLNQNQQYYSASTTVAICDTFDIGCYISTGLSWAFYPTIPLSEQLAEVASTTNGVIPFGYVYDFQDKMTDFSNNSTTSLSISVELSPLMNFLGGSYSSTSFTVLSGNGLRNTMGTTMWNFLQNIISALFAAGFIFYVWRRAHTLL